MWHGKSSWIAIWWTDADTCQRSYTEKIRDRNVPIFWHRIWIYLCNLILSEEPANAPWRAWMSSKLCLVKAFQSATDFDIRMSNISAEVPDQSWFSECLLSSMEFGYHLGLVRPSRSFQVTLGLVIPDRYWHNGAIPEHSPWCIPLSNCLLGSKEFGYIFLEVFRQSWSVPNSPHFFWTYTNTTANWNCSLEIYLWIETI